MENFFTNGKRYRTYSEFLKNKFGSKVYKVSVDAGFTCPNIDGKVAVGGCTYCNNASFTPKYVTKLLSIKQQVIKGIENVKKHNKNANRFIIYFQPHTNTYAPVEILEKFYKEALLSSNEIVGLSIGTRPDSIDEEIIKMIESIAKSYFVTVEYGIESIYNKTLDWVNRGHHYSAVINAMSITKNRGIYIGSHIMLGFPTETKEEIIKSAEEISELPINFLKIHNLHIVKHTALAKTYQKNPFHIFNYEEYLDLICEFIQRISPNIIIERLFADTPRELLIAPNWGKSHIQILQGIEKEMENRNIYQGKFYKD
jgi:radical SAM protein (TIGR01212 family)